MATGDFPQTPWITEQDRWRTFSGGDPFGYPVAEDEHGWSLKREDLSVLSRSERRLSDLIESLVKRIERLEAEVARMKEE